MKESYLKYYEANSPTAIFRFVWDMMLNRSKLQRLSLMNRLKDYQRLAGDSDLLSLHRELNRCLFDATNKWDSYDYGEGYFYQGWDRIGVTGLRDTTARVEAMGLRDLLKGNIVLEIGCNTGFLSLAIADVVERIEGFDLNPHIVDVAKRTAKYLEIDNAEFSITAFEDYEVTSKFDAVLSFANHSTYDGNTRFSIEQFFAQCRDLIQPNGLFIFESHPPHHEGEGLEDVCAIIEKLFEVEDRQVLQYGTTLDTNRTFIVAKNTRAES